MKNILKFLEGKKTYFIAITAGILAGLQAYGIVIPNYVYAILNALGLGALRHSIK
jgi:hypothetical protein